MKLFDSTGKFLFDLNVSKAFASGGEGSVCEHPLNASKVIKVYHKERDLKLEPSLVELSKLNDVFVKPEIIYYTALGKIAGFSMEYIDMNRYVILKKTFNKSFALQNGFDKKVKYTIYKNLKSAIESAHRIGIYIGDLNPYNVLVNTNGDVVMLDVDSFGTKSKPHNGVLLEDIRDWLYHPKVDSNSDKYAFDVLIFWMFTNVHPFRGDYPLHKNIEARVVGKSSLLSGLNIGIPKVYDPFTNPSIIDQFKEVFQLGKRFIVDLSGQPQMLQTVSTAALDIVNSSDLYIRKIESDVVKVSVSNTFLAALKTDGIWRIYSIANFGTYNQLYTVSDASDVYCGNINVVYSKGDYFFNTGNRLSNISNLHGLKLHCVGSTVIALSPNVDKCEVISIDEVINNQILSSQMSLYVKSIGSGDSGLFQQIGDSKWLLDFKGSAFNLIKTPFNVKNVYKRGNYTLIEHLDNNKTRYTFCKISGLKLEIGCDIPDWRYFDEKQGFIFIPEDGKINLMNPINGWKIVSQIDCPISTFDSRIYHTNSGMLMETNNSIYLINKK